MTYDEALQALADRGRFGVHLGLERTQALLAELGDPQLTVRGALVGGTNGKGSVLALAGSALRAAGLRVGQTPKPHLVTYRERIEIDGHPIEADAFTRLVEEVLPIADRVAPRLDDPTEFELLTAMVFAHFARSSIDVALVEVGLGGRLDATNVWDGGVAAITNVDLDHMDRLGPTVVDIAGEKAPIIKRGDRAVSGVTGEGRHVVRARALEMGVALREVTPHRLVDWDRDGITVDMPRLGPTRVGLRGRHQAANVAVAAAILDQLEVAGIARADDDARRRGFATAVWPGRLELVSGSVTGGRDVLLDGAHNPAGAAALAQALDDLRPFLTPGPLTVVTATMSDKDVDGVVAALAASPSLAGARVIVTAVDLPRAMPPDELAARWAAGRPGEDAPVAAAGPDEAMDLALASADGPVVVAGSLYLVGAVRARLVDDPLLWDPT